MREKIFIFFSSMILDPIQSKSSAKRVAALISTITLCIVLLYSTIIYSDIPESIVYSLTCIILGSLGLTSFEKYNTNTDRSSIEIESTTIVEQTSTTK